MSEVLEGTWKIVTESELCSQEYKNTLGSMAVDHADEQALDIVYSFSDHSFDFMVESRKRDMSVTLDMVREDMNKVDAHYDDHMEMYFENTLPNFLKHAKEASGASSYSVWLRMFASNDQFINALQYHNAAREAQQNHPEVQAEIIKQKEAYKLAVQQSVSDGWLHTDALAATDKVDEVAVHIGDPFDTHFNDCLGYYPYRANYVVIGGEQVNGNHHQSTVRNVRTVLKHELNHAVLGRLPSRWLNEAVTEHIAQALDNGQWETVLPDERKNDRGIYALERQLLHKVLADGAFRIDIQQVTQAYSENTLGESFGMLVCMIDDAWSEKIGGEIGLPGRIEYFITQTTEKLHALGMRRVEAQKRAVAEAIQVLDRDPAEFYDTPEFDAFLEKLGVK